MQLVHPTAFLAYFPAKEINNMTKIQNLLIDAAKGRGEKGRSMRYFWCYLHTSMSSFVNFEQFASSSGRLEMILFDAWGDYQNKKYDFIIR